MCRAQPAALFNNVIIRPLVFMPIITSLPRPGINSGSPLFQIYEQLRWFAFHTSAELLSEIAQNA